MPTDIAVDVTHAALDTDENTAPVVATITFVVPDAAITDCASPLANVPAETTVDQLVVYL